MNEYIKQYIVEVNTQRGLQGVRIAANVGDPIDLSDPAFAITDTSALAGPLSTQDTLPNLGNPFSLTYSQP